MTKQQEAERLAHNKTIGMKLFNRGDLVKFRHLTWRVWDVSTPGYYKLIRYKPAEHGVSITESVDFAPMTEIKEE